MLNTYLLNEEMKEFLNHSSTQSSLVPALHQVWNKSLKVYQISRNLCLVGWTHRHRAAS